MLPFETGSEAAMEPILAEMGKHNVAAHEEEDEDIDSEEQESDADERRHAMQL